MKGGKGGGTFQKGEKEMELYKGGFFFFLCKRKVGMDFLPSFIKRGWGRFQKSGITHFYTLYLCSRIKNSQPG